DKSPSFFSLKKVCVFWLGSCLRELSRAVEVLRGLPRGSLFLLLIFSTVFLIWAMGIFFSDLFVF
ncbi:hypothetical protein EBU02_05005, partial [bacterium]|nr:hypothetical protein [bacterium]